MNERALLKAACFGDHGVGGEAAEDPPQACRTQVALQGSDSLMRIHLGNGVLVDN